MVWSEHDNGLPIRGISRPSLLTVKIQEGTATTLPASEKSSLPRPVLSVRSCRVPRSTTAGAM